MKATLMPSKTDWARLKKANLSPKTSAEHPEADVRHVVRGIVRRGLQPLASKASISLRVDQDNMVLRAFRDASV